MELLCTRDSYQSDQLTHRKKSTKAGFPNCSFISLIRHTDKTRRPELWHWPPAFPPVSLATFWLFAVIKTFSVLSIDKIWQPFQCGITLGRWKKSQTSNNFSSFLSVNYTRLCVDSSSRLPIWIRHMLRIYRKTHIYNWYHAPFKKKKKKEKGASAAGSYIKQSVWNKRWPSMRWKDMTARLIY